MRRLVLFGLATVALMSSASAHTGVGDSAGFAHGLMHPISGIDHVLAMVAVGIFAAHLGGRALWLVPLTFVTTMAVAGAFGSAGVPLPFAEVGIGLSVIALGLIVATLISPPLIGAMALVGLFAIFHGHAHGAEMPETASGLAYGAGFLLATAALHAVGVAVGLALVQLGRSKAPRIAQVGGALMAIAGIGILAGAI